MAGTYCTCGFDHKACNMHKAAQTTTGLRLQAAAQAEPWPTASALEQEGVSQLLESEAAGLLQQRYTYLYASAPDLRMDDVPVLLRQYKELVLKHEAMVCAIDAHRASQQSGATPSQSEPAAGASQDAGACSDGIACCSEQSDRPALDPLNTGQALPWQQQSTSAFCCIGHHLGLCICEDPCSHIVRSYNCCLAAAGASHQQPGTVASSPSPHKQAAPLESAQGSGASPFSHASAQAAFSANLDTALPSSSQPQSSATDKPASSPYNHVTHMPFGPTADSPFEQPEGSPTAHTSGQNTEGGQAAAQSSSRSGIDAAGSGHNPSDAQVRNSLTAASQPLPPEDMAGIDAGTVDDRHMTISSGAALDEAMRSENASASQQGAALDRPDAFTMSEGPAASDMFSGLEVESGGQDNAAQSAD